MRRTVDRSPSLLASGLAPALLVLAACADGGGGGGGLSSAMSISSCSLGCGATGQQITCSTQNVALNQEIVVQFTRDVDPSSLTKNTVRLIAVSDGEVPAYALEVDPQNARRVFVRPLVGFDDTGNPTFGLESGETYDLRIPGELQDPPPYVRSADGQVNRNRLACTIAADQGVNDLVPGAPSVSVTVDVVEVQLGLPTVVPDQPADGAVGVDCESDVTFVFDDVMNPATLVNPATDQSDTIQVFVDQDGNTADASDQILVNGTYTLEIDQANLETTVVFTPSIGFPAAGDGAQPRRIVIVLPAAIRDLGNNALSNAGEVVFTPEDVFFPPTTLPDGSGEDFSDTANLDVGATGGKMWSESVSLGGAAVVGAAVGRGGGSGRLGTLVVPSGATVTLDTDMQEFVSSETYPDEVVHTHSVSGASQVVIDFRDTIDVTNAGDEDDPLVVAGGIFEFDELELAAGGVLAFTGSNPARLYVRGLALVRGLVDVSGTDAAAHDSASFLGGAGAAGGVAGASGGTGGDRPDNTGQDLETMMLGGIQNPGAVVDGQDGGGIPQPDPMDPSMTIGIATVGGGAGAGHPANMPTSSMDPSVDNSQCLMIGDPGEPGPSGICFERLATPPCRCEQQGGQGGGGAYALDGEDGTWAPAGPFSVGIAPPFPRSKGGTRDGGPGKLNLESPSDPPDQRTLDPAMGYLRGGSGGGGGGAGLVGTLTDATPSVGDCTQTPLGGFPSISVYDSHSGGGGGAGGGAAQIQAGREIVVDGIVEASGGAGASRMTAGAGVGVFAAPGGGGSGGALLLQSLTISLASLANRLSLAGGPGGVGANGMLGGDGSPGLLRIETDPDEPLPDATTLAPSIAPFDDTDGDGVGDFDGDDDEDDWGGPTSNAILSLGTWVQVTNGPGAFSGLRSCWLAPEPDTFFGVDYEEDDLSGMTPVFGWDMDVISTFADPMTGGPLLLSYRSPSPLLGGIPPEMLCQTTLASGGLIVRFQGARRVLAITDPCSIDETDPNGPILPESVTDWVESPAELNAFWDFLGPQEAARRKPNLIRFQVLFNLEHPICGSLVRGITNLRIDAQPN